MTRMLQTLLVGCMVVTLTACGASNDGSSSADGPQDTAGAAGTPNGAADPSTSDPAGENPAEPVDDPAPTFEVETFDGETFSLAKQRGTPVVLNFWESW